MRTTKQLAQLDHIVVTLSHLPAIDGDHVVVQPIHGRHFVVAHYTLCNFTFVVRKLQIHPSAMYIKLIAKILGAHCRTFNMPSWVAYAPGTLPTHDVLWCCIFPQGKIHSASLLFLCIQFTGSFQLVFDNPSTENAILQTLRAKIFVVFFYIKINRTIGLVCITICYNFFNHHNLLHNMASCSWLNTRLHVIKFSHRPMKKIGVFLHQLHGF